MHPFQGMGIDNIELISDSNLQHRRNVLRWMLQVLIQSNHPITASMQNPRDGGWMLAKIPREMKHPHPCTALRQGAQHNSGFINGVVVNEDHLFQV